MSLGLAISRIAFYTGKREAAASTIKDIEMQLAQAVHDQNDVRQAELQAQLTKEQILFGLYKNFVEFWTDVIKSTLELLKKISELAFAGR